jgi:hypothetical protein
MVSGTTTGVLVNSPVGAEIAVGVGVPDVVLPPQETTTIAAKKMPARAHDWLIC